MLERNEEVLFSACEVARPCSILDISVSPEVGNAKELAARSAGKATETCMAGG